MSPSKPRHVPDDEPYGGYFPGDPRVLGYVLTPTVDALKSNQWLSTHLLDSIIEGA